MRHLLSIDDLPADAIIGIFFRQTLTRTRTAFSSGALRLGPDPDWRETCCGAL
jgi:ornithine carbamoyltransferase